MVAEQIITLFRGFQASNCYTWSPFVTKLETRLRLGGLSYRIDVGSPFSSPRGKLPYITLQQPGQPDESMSDSTMITRAFIQTGLLQDLNARLTPVEKAYDLAITSMLEDRLYFYQGQERWVENYYTLRPVIFRALPYVMQVIVGNLAYSKMVRTLYGQGTGRFNAEEIADFRKEVWERVNDLLVASRASAMESKHGNELPFWLFGGGEPSEADATVYGFIASGLVCKAAPDTNALIKSFPAIMDYATRIHRQYFPDYQMWE